MLDAAAYWPPKDEAYFFRNDFHIRYRLASGEGVEEVMPFSARRWKDLPYDGGIDAVATVYPDNALYFFKESTFAAYSFSDMAMHTQPVAVKDFFNLPPGWQGDFDTVVFWPPNGKLYFFKGAHYIPYNLGQRRVESEPRFIAQYWKGLTFSDIDASFVGKRGTAYFFKGGEYIRYIVAAQGDRAREPARPIAGHWPGLVEALTSIPAPAGGQAPSDSSPQPTSGSSKRTMEVGFNYAWAWNIYGQYFGGGEKIPGSHPSMDRWTKDLQTNLRRLKTDLNIRHVRIFLLCNANNYGTVVAGGKKTIGGKPIHNFKRDRFTPPSSLHPKYLEHLKRMLEAFRSEEMLVIPSVIDFGAFHPLTVGGGGGRADIANDLAIRLVFFEQVLEPFVRTSISYKDAIYAWEVINEPIWNTDMILASGKEESPFATADVSKTLMFDFIKNALELMERLGFASKSTVGHRFYNNLAEFPTGAKRQFHYYARPTDPPLPDFSTSKAFIGEISCQLPAGFFKRGETGPWPELNGSDTVDVTTAVYERLRLLKVKGYQLAFLWPDIPGVAYADPSPPFDTLKLSTEAQAGIKKFMASP